MLTRNLVMLNWKLALKFSRCSKTGIDRLVDVEVIFSFFKRKCSQLWHAYLSGIDGKKRQLDSRTPQTPIGQYFTVYTIWGDRHKSVKSPVRQWRSRSLSQKNILFHFFPWFPFLPFKQEICDCENLAYCPLNWLTYSLYMIPF